jgi:hypothetical protein
MFFEKRLLRLEFCRFGSHGGEFALKFPDGPDCGTGVLVEAI